jgi:basic membrane protein A and related proteins
MRKHPSSLVAVGAIVLLILAACTGGGGASPSGVAQSEAASQAAESEAPEESASESGAATSDFSACMVSDTGGVDDRGFNQNSYDGLERAEEELGIEIAFLESTAATDYERNINTFIDQGCDVIVTVGFLLGDATAAAAEANPDQLFSIVDFAYDPAYENVQGLVFDTKSASMLAGYLAAAMSETGVVGTFGGIQIAPVVDFMVGFEAGVNYYNDEAGTNVDVIGWDSAAESGTFTGDFENQDNGRQTAEALMQEGADIIFPVAGPVGLGAMAAVQDSGGDAIYIGVDVDQAVSVPDHENIMLSSVLKRLDNAVFASIEDAMDGSFEEPLYVGTLENEGVGLAPFHQFEEEVPQEVQDGIDALREALISGEVNADDWATGAPEG